MAMTGTAASGSALISALERAWATIRRHHPGLPDVVVITGTGLRHAASANMDARWGRLDLRPDRKPELFVAGECLAEGAEHTLTTVLHEAAHALADARRIQDTSRQGKYHNRRFVELAAELGLAWPSGARAHPVSGFSEVRMTDPARTAYADTIADLEATITLHLDTLQRQRLAGTDPAAAGTDPAGDSGAGEGAVGRTFNRAKLVCGCYPERSIRVSPKQAARGPILCGACGKEFRIADTESARMTEHGGSRW